MKSLSSSSLMIIVIILVVLAIIIGLLFASGGIPSPLPAFTSSKSVGAVPVIENSSTQKVGLNEAFSQLPIWQVKYQNNTQSIKIFSVTGLFLDNEGKANSWLFIAKQQNQTKFIEVNARGLTTSKWSGDVAGPEIEPMNVILPGDLLKTHHSKLKTYMDNQWDFNRIDLKNNNYTLTLKNGSDQKIFVFRSINGELIQG
jgi:hypothetical protein